MGTIRSFEVKTETGAVFTWDGETGEDAARRFMASHPEAGSIVATRPADRHGVFPMGRNTRIVEPGDRDYGA